MSVNLKFTAFHAKKKMSSAIEPIAMKKLHAPQDRAPKSAYIPKEHFLFHLIRKQSAYKSLSDSLRLPITKKIT
jgi:hypothetical protein